MSVCIKLRQYDAGFYHHLQSLKYHHHHQIPISNTITKETQSTMEKKDLNFFPFSWLSKQKKNNK